MRVGVLALLWALASCDQIFGIERTQPWDAQLPIDAPNWPTAITWETFDHGVVTDDPIDGLTVNVGVLDLGSDVTAISPAPPLAVDGSGTFQVPYSLAFAPYRVVFTAPDGVTTEIQTGLHGFAWGFPIYGRHDRGSAAPGATFSGTAGSAGGAAPVRLLTTGLWSVTEGGTAGGSGAFSFAYGSGLSLSGPLGVLDSTQGDLAIVELGTGTTATGYAVFPAGIGSAGTAPFQTSSSTTVTWNTNYSQLGQRITNQVGFTGALANHYAWAGAIPTTTMPSFVQPPNASRSSQAADAMAALAPPVMLPLDEGNATGSGVSTTFVNPFAGGSAGSATLVMYEAEIAARAVPAMAPITQPTYLPAGIQTLTKFDGSNHASPSLGAGIAISLAGAMTFGGTSLGGDGVAITRGNHATLPLVFGTDRPVDDCIVTVYSVADDPTGSAATLAPHARYIVMDAPASPNQPVMIATSLFDPSSVYTFGIHCEFGHELSGNDYRAATYPFSATTTFSPLFTMP